MVMNECREIEQVARRTGLEQREQAWGSPYYPEAGRWFSPALDVYEDGDEVRVSVELPGVGEGDVSTTIVDGSLVVAGQKKPAGSGSDKLCACSERCYGSFRRTLRLPASIDADAVSARFERGVLEVVLPKRAEARARKVEVKG